MVNDKVFFLTTIDMYLVSEPASGVVGLPPPRSAYRERAKQQEAERKRQNAANPQQRVKVFMPQQYNSPLSMYSAKNVVHSFQTQAEGYYDQKEGWVHACCSARTNNNYAYTALQSQKAVCVYF